MTIECAVTHKWYGTARQVQYKLLKRERVMVGWGWGCPILQHSNGEKYRVIKKSLCT